MIASFFPYNFKSARAEEDIFTVMEDKSGQASIIKSVLERDTPDLPGLSAAQYRRLNYK